MKEFKSKGISLEGIVGENPVKEKKTAGKAYNQSIAITEDLVWELRSFASDHRCRGVKTVLEKIVGCFVRDSGPRQTGRILEKVCKQVNI